MGARVGQDESPGGFSWWTQLTSAFSGVGTWLGIALAAIAVFNWATRTLNISLNAVFDQLRTAYETLFYPIADFLTGLLDVTLTSMQKDVLLLYMLLAGAVARTLFVYIAGFSPRPNTFGNTSALDWAAHKLCGRPVTNLLVISTSALIWPFIVPFFLATPVLVKSDTFSLLWSWRGIRVFNRLDPETSWAGWTFVDLRAVFVLQTFAIAAVVTALAFANAAGVD
jgi:hypothetical protein